MEATLVSAGSSAQTAWSRHHNFRLAQPLLLQASCNGRSPQCSTGRLSLRPQHSWGRQSYQPAPAPCAVAGQAAESAPCNALACSQLAHDIKQELLKVVAETNRGIFGTKATQREQVEALLRQLESLNPLQSPTEHLHHVAGSWRLLYTTITILGSKRTRLGLREIIKLGDFLQHIDTERQHTVNEVQFNVAGLSAMRGALRVEASYQPVSPTRVAIKFEQATLEPEQLQKLFEQNYELLLSIFNPDGWLDITYVDNHHRVGRDDKGNVFLLQRC